MSKPFILAPIVRQHVEEKLKEALTQLQCDIDASRANICYVESDELVNAPQALRIPDSGQPVLQMPWYHGLTGLSIRENSTFVWPLEEQTRDCYRPVEPEVISEIMGPLHYSKGIVGTVWVDRIGSNPPFTLEDKDVFMRSLVAMSDFLNCAAEEIDNAGQQLKAIAEDCLKQTSSVRGYIATRRRDGTLDYVLAGESQDVFLGLSQFEGLCGQVFQSGKMLNIGNVHSNPSYIPSDPDIHSEIISPIFDNDSKSRNPSDVIGIINMESNNYDAYPKSLEFMLESRAEKARPAARLYRDRIRHGGIDFLPGLVDAFLRAEHRPRQILENHDDMSDIMAQVCSYARSTLDAAGVDWIVDLSSVKSQLVSRLGAENIVSESHGQSLCIYCNVLLSGRTLGVIKAMWQGATRQSTSELESSVRQLCYYVGLFFGRSRQQQRFSRFVELIAMLTSSAQDETSLTHVVKEVPLVLESRHCTILYISELFGQQILVPGPSSIGAYPKKETPETYYELDASSSLTSWVAATGRPLRIANIEDEGELSSIDSRLKWGAKVAEVVDTKPRAFLAFPLIDHFGRTIGVIRTFRDLSNRRSSFTKEDMSIMGSIAALATRPLSAYINRKSRALQFRNGPRRSIKTR